MPGPSSTIVLGSYQAHNSPLTKNEVYVSCRYFYPDVITPLSIFTSYHVTLPWITEYILHSEIIRLTHGNSNKTSHHLFLIASAPHCHNFHGCVFQGFIALSSRRLYLCFALILFKKHYLECSRCGSSSIITPFFYIYMVLFVTHPNLWF